MQNIRDQETYVQKVLEIQNQSTGITCEFRMRILYLPSTRQINISRAIAEVHSRGTLLGYEGLHIEHSQFFYEDNERRMYVFFGTYPFTSPVLLKYQKFLHPVIKIRYKKIHHPDSPKNKKPQTSQTSRKLKQRTIGEVLELVRRWRQLHRRVNERGKRLYTLQSAARELGISKKTLDDYSHQITKGEYYSFDFEKHKYDRIGVLRQFIKQKKLQMKQLQNTDNYWALDSDDDKRRSSDSDY